MKNCCPVKYGDVSNKKNVKGYTAPIKKYGGIRLRDQSPLGTEVWSFESLQHPTYCLKWMVWYGMIWYDTLGYDMISSYHIISYHITSYDMIWDNMIWSCMIWYDMIWYDMIWHDMVWYDMIWYITSYNIISYHMMHATVEVCQEPIYFWGSELEELYTIHHPKPDLEKLTSATRQTIPWPRCTTKDIANKLCNSDEIESRSPVIQKHFQLKKACFRFRCTDHNMLNEYHHVLTSYIICSDPCCCVR